MWISVWINLKEKIKRLRTNLCAASKWSLCWAVVAHLDLLWVQHNVVVSAALCDPTVNLDMELKVAMYHDKIFMMWCNTDFNLQFSLSPFKYIKLQRAEIEYNHVRNYNNHMKVINRNKSDEHLYYELLSSIVFTAIQRS